MKILGPIDVVEIADEMVDTDEAVTPNPELIEVIDKVLF